MKARTAVVRSVHFGGARTRAELASELGLNRSTIKAAVDDLVADGLVTEHTDAQGTAGRPSMVVDPVASSAWVVAVDAAIDALSVTAIGLGGATLGELKFEPTAGDRDPDTLVARIATAVAVLRMKVDKAPSALGVAVPGLVRSADNVVRSAPNLGWIDVPLGEKLERVTGIATRVANESDLGAIAEHLRGCARDVDDLVFVMGDVGVGGGVISAGSVLVGSGGYAGELGHMRVRPDGRRCGCGATGCWETEVGLGALQRVLGAPKRTSVDDICRRLRDIGSGVTSRPAGLDDEYAQWLSMGVTNLVALYDPRVIVFAGLFADAATVLAEPLRRAVRASLVGRQDGVDLRIAELGKSATTVGAAELAFSAVLTAV